METIPDWLLKVAAVVAGLVLVLGVGVLAGVLYHKLIKRHRLE